MSYGNWDPRARAVNGFRRKRRFPRPILISTSNSSRMSELVTDNVPHRSCHRGRRDETHHFCAIGNMPIVHLICANFADSEG